MVRLRALNWKVLIPATVCGVVSGFVGGVIAAQWLGSVSLGGLLTTFVTGALTGAVTGAAGRVAYEYLFTHWILERDRRELRSVKERFELMKSGHGGWDILVHLYNSGNMSASIIDLHLLLPGQREVQARMVERICRGLRLTGSMQTVHLPPGEDALFNVEILKGIDPETVEFLQFRHSENLLVKRALSPEHRRYLAQEKERISKEGQE